MICPKCKSRAIGRIGQNQYYCWDCNIEFVPTKDGYRSYRLEADGTVVLDSVNGALVESPATSMSSGSQVQGAENVAASAESEARPTDEPATQSATQPATREDDSSNPGDPANPVARAQDTYPV